MILSDLLLMYSVIVSLLSVVPRTSRGRPCSRGSYRELTEIWARLETLRLESLQSTHHSTTTYYCQASQGSAHTFGPLRSENSDSRHPNIICNTQTIQTNARIITHLQILAINTRQTGWGHSSVFDWKYHR